VQTTAANDGDLCRAWYSTADVKTVRDPATVQRCAATTSNKWATDCTCINAFSIAGPCFKDLVDNADAPLGCWYSPCMRPDGPVFVPHAAKPQKKGSCPSICKSVIIARDNGTISNNTFNQFTNCPGSGGSGGGGTITPKTRDLIIVGAVVAAAAALVAVIATD